VLNHDVNSLVTFGLASDLAQLGTGEGVPVPLDKENLVTIGQNTTTIPCPNRDTIFLITKGSALGSTAIANPTAAQDGLQITFLNTSAFAHVITSSPGIQNGVTGGPKTTLTSPAFGGGTLTLVALQGQWWVRANNLWVIT
jgi:hypothetical protein